MTQNPLYVQSWNLETTWVLISALCKQSLGVPDHVTKILSAQNEQKLDEFEPIYLVINYRYWWKMVCNFWAHYHHLSFGYVCLPQLEYYFSSFCFYFLTFFSFISMLSTFKPLNALYSKFERLKIHWRTFVQLNSGVLGWGNSPRSGPPKIWTFKPLEINGSKDIKNKLTQKNWGCHDGGFPPNELSKTQTFLNFKLDSWNFWGK